ncbi:MAG TPA: tail fiber domain-containing protein [Panacibacter sp.]|nr:tail fiber domain-containing protein [Panacibacter sp.]
MKTKITSGKKFIAIAALLIFSGGQLMAQSWSTTGNAGIAAGTNYLGTSDPNDLVFRSNAIERGRLLGATGEWRFGGTTNYVSIDGAGRLRFNGTGVYQVGSNKYAFQLSADPNYGLFFNTTLGQYEFRDGTASSVFAVAGTGNAVLKGTLKVGAYTLPATDGAVNQVLKTNGAGVLAWSADNSNTYTAGTGIGIAANVVTNTAPDQVVALTGSNGITTSGTYPNFTINGASLWRTTGNAGTTAATNFIGTTDNAGFAIRTNNTERIRVEASGGIGMGTTAPNSRLHINATGASEDGLRVQIAGNSKFFVANNGGVTIGTLFDTPPVNGLYVSGNVGVGNSTPLNKLDVTGNIGLTGSVLFTNAAAGSGLTFTDAQTIRDNSANTNLEVELHGNWLPDSDNSHSLGNSTQRWIDVWAIDGTINTSDLRDKTNIRDMRYGLKEIMQLRPVSFNWKNFDTKQDKLGVIAQEIQKVMPEVVRDYELKVNETTGKTEKVPSARLGVMYADMIPVLIKAIQELQLQIEDLKKGTTNSSVATVNESSAVAQPVNIDASLDQNAPNPFNTSTVIRYRVPASAGKAQIIVSNTAGNTVKAFTIATKGSGSVSINGGELSAGSYYYTLIIDGKKADSKQMILVK